MLNGDPANTDISLTADWETRLRMYLHAPKHQFQPPQKSLAKMFDELLTAVMYSPTFNVKSNGRDSHLFGNGLTNSLTDGLIHQYNNPNNTNVVALILQPIVRALNAIQLTDGETLGPEIEAFLLGTPEELQALSQKVEAMQNLLNNDLGQAAGGIMTDSATKLSGAATSGGGNSQGSSGKIRDFILIYFIFCFMPLVG